MNILNQIKKSKKKHKQLVLDLANKIKKDKKLFSQLVDAFEAGSDVEKGTCAEVMKYVTVEKPEYALFHIGTIIKYINYDAPRVKWGCPETIGNVAKKFPDKVEKAIPNLFINTKDKSTVVRWCAAYALTETAKYNSKKQKELISKFKIIIEKEQNNGVKNVYLKTLKILDKQ
ncbi:hypothetical protein KKA02_00275 [Patescibacteria group bacterium]|nr:hypothetical protein [Patescibacteria group bacterium]